MGKPHHTFPYTLPDFLQMKEELSQAISTIDDAIGELGKSRSEIWVFGRPQQLKTFKALLNFTAEVRRSVVATKSGRPFRENQRKERATSTAPDFPGVDRGSQMSSSGDVDVRAEADGLVSRTRRRQSKEAVKKAASTKSAEDKSKTTRKKRSG